MPTVPTYDNPQVQSQPLPNAMVQGISPRVLMQNEEGAREIQRFGGAMSALGNEQMQEKIDQQNMLNDAIIAKRVNQAQVQTEAVLHDPKQGILNKVGEEATNLRPAAIEALPTAETMTDGLNNIQAQHVADIVSKMHVQSLAAIDSHTAVQTKAFAHGQFVGMAAAQDGIAANALASGDVASYYTALGTKMHAIEKALTVLGNGSREAVSNAQAQGLSELHVAVLNNLLSQPDKIADANAYFKAHENEIVVQQRDDARRRVNTVDNGVQAVSAVDAAIAKHGMNDSAGIEADLLAEFHNNSQGLNDARRELGYRQAQQQQQVMKADNTSLGNLQLAIENGKGWGDITSSPAYGALQQSAANGSPEAAKYLAHVSSYFDAHQKKDGGEQIDDAQLFNDLSNMSATDQSKFTQTNLALFKGQLTPAHLDYLTKLRDGISRGDLRTQDLNTIMHNAVGDAKETLRASGINLTAKPGTDAAKNAEAFEASLRDSLLSAQNAKQGVPLSRDEARKITEGALKDVTLGNTRLLGYWPTTVAPWKMTPEQKAAPWEVPETEIPAIQSSLQRAGIPVTSDAIQTVYKRSKGVR